MGHGKTHKNSGTTASTLQNPERREDKKKRLNHLAGDKTKEAEASSKKVEKPGPFLC